MDNITIDAILKILLFLKPSDVLKFSLTSKYYFNAINCNGILWKELCESGFGKTIGDEILKQIQRENDNTITENRVIYKHVSRILQGIQKSTHYKLKRLYVNTNDDPHDNSNMRMEGHAACTLYDRFICIVGGWGPDRANTVHILDGSRLPDLTKLCVRTIGRPQFKYGFTVINAPNCKNRLYMYGGCKSGGYSGDCRDFYTIDFQFFIQKSDGTRQEVTCENEISNLDIESNDISVVATYTNCDTNSSSGSSSSGNSSNETDKYKPRTRGYHSAVMVKTNGRDSMLVWGGLHQGGPTGLIEIYDIESNIWRTEICIGKEPPDRFGHTCSLVGDSQLVFVGGSDGSDLLRNGRELRDIHVLTVYTELSTTDHGCLHSTYEWTTPVTTYATFPFSAVPGRCHCVIQTSPGSSKLVCFGGGARNSNAIVILDFDKDLSGLHEPNHSRKVKVLPLHEVAANFTRSDDMVTQNVVQLSTPAVYSDIDIALPAKRTSTVAVRIGKYMFIHGGWSNHYRELGDFWLVDLSYSTSDERIQVTSRAKTTSANSSVSSSVSSCASSSAVPLPTVVCATLLTDTDGDYEQDMVEAADDDDDDENPTATTQSPMLQLLLGLLSGQVSDNSQVQAGYYTNSQGVPQVASLSWINQVLNGSLTSQQLEDNTYEENDDNDEEQEEEEEDDEEEISDEVNAVNSQSAAAVAEEVADVSVDNVHMIMLDEVDD